MSDDIDETQKTWDAISKSFDATRKKPWKICLDFIDQLESSNIVADIGCGNGRHLIPSAKKCRYVYGIDISIKLLKIAKQKLNSEKLKNFTLIHSTNQNIPLNKDSINSILYIASLHNIKQRKMRIQSLKEVKRILRKDGKGLISVWKPDFQDDINKDAIVYWKQNKLNIPRYYHFYEKKEFIEDIKSSGLELQEIKDVMIKSKNKADNYFAFVTKK